MTSTIVWEGDESPGRWREYEGGYEDWRTQRERRDRAAGGGPKRDAAGEGADHAACCRLARSHPPSRPRKLSYKEQRELDQELPARIEALEVEQKELGVLMASADFYFGDPVRVESAQMRYAQIDDELLLNASSALQEMFGAR